MAYGLGHFPESEKYASDLKFRRKSDFCQISKWGLSKWGLSKWGLSKWGLKVLVHDCLRLSPFCDESRGPKRPQKCTIVDDCARIAESGLKPPFESPHLDFPEFLPNFRLRNSKILSPKNAIPYPQPFHTPTRLPPISCPRSSLAHT